MRTKRMRLGFLLFACVVVIVLLASGVQNAMGATQGLLG